ncbi:MAG: ABC transporter permease subunit [Phycisphaerales bacterium]|jgi:ABC-type transport system involved in multi-copper enzyme maturation permease subunit|nr:ABC transporter permease subunit [Phycisphaerales bacterium]
MPVLLRWLLNLGPTNPIAVRLVQNGSRRGRHNLVRSIYLAVLIIALLWALLLNTGAGALRYRELAHAGASSFTAIAYLQIGLICVLAPVFFSAAIAQESSPRTWEVLLTTPMSAGQIVLGNLIGRLFFVLALLFSSLPLFAITQYFGGVPGRTIFASYAIAGCAAVLVGSAAIALAVSRLVGKRAVFTFYICVVSTIAITAGVDAWLRNAGLGAGGGGVTWMTALNPFLALHAMLDPATYPRATPGSRVGLAAWFLERPITTWCALSLGTSFVLMVASTLTVRAGGLRSVAQGSSGVPLHRRLMGLGASGAEHRAPRTVWHNPIAWREAAARNATLWRIIARWSFIGAGGLFGIALLALYHGGALKHDEFRLALNVTLWAEIGVITLVALNMSATAISREREDGTLDLLLTTPLTPSMYLTGKLRGLIAYLLPMLSVPLGTLALASLYVLAEGLGRAGGVNVSETMYASGGSTQINVPVVLPEGALAASVVCVAFTALCVMIGLQWSLKSRGTIGSVVASVGVVGAIVLVLGACGFKSGQDFPVIGPALVALSPGSLILAITDAGRGMIQTVQSGPDGLGTARISLLIGAVLSAGAYLGVVYALHASMVRTFDVTTRKLAGAK